MPSTAMAWDRRSSGDTRRNAIFCWHAGKFWCNCCLRHFLFFRPVLTYCYTCIIHQSIRNSMRIAAIAIDWRRIAYSFRIATSCWQVSAFVSVVSVVYRYFDQFSPMSAHVSYINLSRIRYGLTLCYWVCNWIVFKCLMIDILNNYLYFFCSSLIKQICSPPIHLRFPLSLHQRQSKCIRKELAVVLWGYMFGRSRQVELCGDMTNVFYINRKSNVFMFFTVNTWRIVNIISSTHLYISTKYRVNQVCNENRIIWLRKSRFYDETTTWRHLYRNVLLRNLFSINFRHWVDVLSQKYP